ALVQAFAGGATIAVLADTLFPEAYREGGWWVGLATACGFLTAFALG
ncbi:MAG: ZIP family metal transporter, partial [Actinomycetales bacterium]